MTEIGERRKEKGERREEKGERREERGERREEKCGNPAEAGCRCAPCGNASLAAGG